MDNTLDPDYTPDAWVVLKLTSKGQVHYRILAGWYGGFLGADSWRVNSGITKITDEGKYYSIFGESGSVYNCFKEYERMSGYMAQIYRGFASQNTENLHVELIDFKDLPEELLPC